MLADDSTLLRIALTELKRKHAVEVQHLASLLEAANTELEVIRAENIFQNEELFHAHRALRSSREVVRSSSFAASTNSDDGGDNIDLLHDTIENLRADIDVLKDKAEQQRLLYEAERGESARLRQESKLATRKNTTMLLQVKFMEAQIDMLRNEKTAEGNGVSDVSILQLQQELESERQSKLRSEALCHKYKQAQAVLLGLMQALCTDAEGFVSMAQRRSEFLESLLETSSVSHFEFVLFER